MDGENAIILSQILDSSVEGIIITDPETNILKVNPAFCRLTGYTPAEIVGKKPNIFKSGKHSKEFYEQMWAALLKRGEWQGVIWNHRKSGEEYTEWLTIHTIQDEAGKVSNYFAICSDMSLWEYAHEAVYIVDENGYILYANQLGPAMFGLADNSSLIGKYYGDFFNSTDRAGIKHQIDEAIQGKSKGLVEGAITKNNGQVRFIESVSLPFIFPGKAIMVILDITDRKNAEEQLHQNERRFHQMAYFDQLTQLPNRAALEEQLSHSINHCMQNKQKIAVMYIGLRKISFITNMYNLSIGDRIKKEAVSRIQEHLRAHDLLFRISERDFIAILTYDNSILAITAIAEAILNAFRSPFIEDRYEFHVHVNIGINTFICNENDTETFIKNAYIAYRRAKELGINTVVVSSPDMNIQTRKTFTLQNDLHKALENGELELYFQPRIDPFTFKIISAEALLRWNHPIFGIVSPSDFIPLAEESDLILSIGEWVIRAACKQNRDWQDARCCKIPISINISGKQLMQKDFVDVVEKIIAETGLDVAWVEFEVTESTIFNNEEVFLDAISKLQESGVKIAIDDFGTGYSSLSRLKQFKCNTVKLDRSFINNMEENPDNRIIVESIIKLSHTLGMTIVAEGVETAEQFHFLQAKNCDEVQGFLFSKPIPGKEFEKLLRAGACYYLENHIMPFAT